MPKRTKIFLSTISTLLLLLSIPKSAIAAAPSLISYPNTINIDDSFTIQATMSGLSNNSVYKLRVAMTPTSTSNYFGSTYNGSDWYNGTPSPIDYTKFLSITTDSNGAWWGDIMGKIQSNDPNYNNIGTSKYDLKVGRYTQTGSTATWSSPMQTTLVAPTPTPTSTPTSTPTPTPTPIPTKTPIATPTKIPTPSPTKSISLTKSPTITATKSASISAVPTSVLGTKTKSSKNNQPQPKTLIDSATKNKLPVAMVVGSVFLIACAIIAYLIIRKKNAKNTIN